MQEDIVYRIILCSIANISISALKIHAIIATFADANMVLFVLIPF